MAEEPKTIQQIGAPLRDGAKAEIKPKLDNAYPKSKPLPEWVKAKMQRVNQSSGFGASVTTTPAQAVTKGAASPGMSGVLRQTAHPSTAQAVQAGQRVATTAGKAAGNFVKAGVQAGIITAGFKEWDKILSNPEMAENATKDARTFYDSIKDLPPHQQAAAMASLSIDVAKEVRKNFLEVGQEVVAKGVDIAKSLYDMTPEQRGRFLSDACNGTVNNLKDIRANALEILKLPIEDKLALAKNLGDRAYNKARTWAVGAKRIFDAVTSR